MMRADFPAAVLLRRLRQQYLALLWDVLLYRALDRGCGRGGSDAGERAVAGLGGRAGALAGAFPVGLGPRGAAVLGAGLPQGPDPAGRAQERRAAGGTGGAGQHRAAAPLHRRLALGEVASAVVVEIR